MGELANLKLRVEALEKLVEHLMRQERKHQTIGSPDPFTWVNLNTHGIPAVRHGERK